MADTLDEAKAAFAKRCEEVKRGNDGSWFRMASAPRKRHLSSEQRRALELLASSPHGATEELLAYGHGFSRRMLGSLVRAGLATVPRRVIMAGDRPIKVGKVRIATAGLNGAPQALLSVRFETS